MVQSKPNRQKEARNYETESFFTSRMEVASGDDGVKSGVCRDRPVLGELEGRAGAGLEFLLRKD